MDKKRIVYLDNAATTPVLKEVVDKMLPFFTEKFANPMTYLHSSLGFEAYEAMENAREKAAALINAKPENIIFTSGGTEADNFAIKGVALFKKSKGNHIITSKIEHHAVLHTTEALKRLGFEITYLDVDPNGFIDLEQLKRSIKNETILISIMHSNNEIGTIEPVEEITKIAHEKDILFHTDAVQSAGHIPVDVEAISIDLLSVSAHKFNGPKGVGFLYIKDKSEILPFMDGGGQEYGLRASTHNVPGIVGLGEAARISLEDLGTEMARITDLRDYMFYEIVKSVGGITLNGDKIARLPQNLNIQIEGIDNEALLVALNREGIIAAGGSACTATETIPSHVLTAIGLKGKQAKASLRFSLGKYTTKEDIDYVLSVLPELVKKIRSLRG